MPGELHCIAGQRPRVAFGRFRLAGCTVCSYQKRHSGYGQLAALAGDCRFDQVLWQVSPMLLVGTKVPVRGASIREPRGNARTPSESSHCRAARRSERLRGGHAS
jgi:hypothetical protein